ncbi:MAG: S9 family peptidase [Alphaproteobacteria bacterium]|nr:S9 family peptidase [Alphaproteobacteria bacterium]
MTPFFTKARKQVTCALLLASCGLLAAPDRAEADALDDAIAFVKQRDEAPLWPREAIARRAALKYVRMAPDGNSLAYSLQRGTISELWLYDITRNRHSRLFASKMVDQFFWSADSRFLFLESTQGIAVVSLHAPEAPAFLVNLDNEADELFYGIDPTHPHAALVSTQTADKQGHDFFRITPEGEKSHLFSSSQYVGEFLPSGPGDSFFVVRIKGMVTELVRLDSSGEKHLLDCDLGTRCRLIGFSSDSDNLFMMGAFGEDLVGLYGVDASTGEATLIHRDPTGTFDLEWVIMNHDTNTPAATGYKNDHTAFYGLTADGYSALKHLQSASSAKQLFLRASGDLSRWLVVDATGMRPDISVYTPETGQFVRPLADILAQREPAELAGINQASAPRIPVWYRVSDGMRQQGYVTLPLGHDPATVPLILMPHGGPWTRTDGAWHTQAQFLANRGYAVFEPNYRASTGFGKDYTLSANRDFGDGRVQQDMIDGLNYVLSRGVGNADKLAVFGHSFGGFSTLGALSFTPDLFQVGIAGAPPVDLSKSLKYFSTRERSPEFKMRLEHFKKLTVDLDDAADVKRIRSQSPDAHWEQVSQPLYIWAGGKDPKVSVLNVRDYALRLREGGKAITLIEEPSAGHSPNQEIQREAYLYMIEKALADHLQGRMDKSLSEKLARHLKRTITIDENKLGADLP